MLSFATRSYLSYRQEVDYKGFNEAIRITLMSYHQSRMQGASTIKLSLSATLTLMINTLLPHVENKALKRVAKPDEEYKQDSYLNLKLITRGISEASLDRTWIYQGTRHRESTDRLASPPYSSLTLHLTISIYKTRSYGGLIFS
jgi:hypothetical protein